MNGILRVFPTVTAHTPMDDYVRFGFPDLFPIPQDVKAIHISCVFTWDRELVSRMSEAWHGRFPKIPIYVGGPFMDPPGEFIPGMYVKPGITFTSRGCPEKCPWCFVPKWEGGIRTVAIQPGHIIQDNNILATPKDHFERVCEMLGKQRKAAKFVGGLQAARFTQWHADKINSMRIEEVWFAADHPGNLPAVRKAVARLKLPRRKIRCYVLVGHNTGETVEKATERLEAAWDAGTLPFIQLFRGTGDRKIWPKRWRALAKQWSRPAAMRMAHGGY